MGIETIWAISTGHIMQATAKDLDDWVKHDAQLPFTLYPHGEFGWLINVVGLGGERAPLDEVKYRDLDAIIVAAIELSVCWVLLDRDADIVRHLPVYDW